MKYRKEIAENFYLTLYTNVTGTEGYDVDKEIVFVGDQFQNYPEVKYEIGALEYQGVRFDVNVYSKVNIMELYIGQSFRNLTEQEQAIYQDTICDMGVYPAQGSILLMDDVVLVKIAD